MMKSWSRLCFLVLVISSVSRGQDRTTDPPGNRKEATRTSLPNGPTPSSDEPHREAAAADTTPSTPPSTPSTQNNTSTNATDVPSTALMTQGGETQSADVSLSKTTEEVNGSTAWSTVEGRTSSTPVTIEGADHSSWGYVLLVLILLVIIVLCVILYFLRRVSRTYSFDLHRQVPANHLNEPIGTFEPVYLDDLDRPASKDQVTTDDLSPPPPVSNGTTLQSEERGSNGESAPQEQPDANGLMETSPTSDTSPSLGDDPAERTPSPLSSTNMFFDAIGEEQQNENNNNPSVCSSDPFVEINLDDPAWCDRLLTSPEVPSSVLPFSPFSFSSSSSSSS